jgi:cell wall-associated NlpC family hydrolase
MGIALALLSVGSTLNPLPTAAATEGRALRRADALGGTSTSPESTNLGVRESVGQTFALLAARASGAGPAQVYPAQAYPTPDPNNGVRVIYAPDARGPLPPAVTVSNSSLPPAFATNTGPNSLLGPPMQNSGPAGPTPPGAPGMPGAVNGAAPGNLAGAPGVVNGAVAPNGTAQQTLTGAATGVTAGQQATTATANARGVLPLTAASNTGAPGTATGPALASTTSGASGGSSAAGRVFPSVPATANGARIIGLAQTQVGARYTWAGTSPATGFDCSGFVYWVFNSLGVNMPRTMDDQLASGRRIPVDQLRPGDVVYFTDTYTSGLSHNGIYIGNGEFIHAVDESVGVAVTRMNSAYWADKYYTANRPME